jgi:hypothetical protein
LSIVDDLLDKSLKPTAAQQTLDVWNDHVIAAPTVSGVVPDGGLVDHVVGKEAAPQFDEDL